MSTTPDATSGRLRFPSYSVHRWRRHGHDRLYVRLNTAAEAFQLGYRDLRTGIDHPVRGEDLGLLRAVIDAWAGGESFVGTAPPRPGPDPAAEPPSRSATTEPWTDLTTNRPGASAQVQADARRAEAPVRTFMARLLGVHTPERAWRIGAQGERLVADQLSRLARMDARWTAIHAIPVGRRGADIDHLVIGPGGIFTLNAKHHPDAHIWVGGDTVIVNGSRVPYVRNARHEAERASRLLGQAAGRYVPVSGVVVAVGCRAPLSIREQPRGVVVVTRRDLTAWLSRLSPVWSDQDLTAIWQAARRSTTWVR